MKENEKNPAPPRRDNPKPRPLFEFGIRQLKYTLIIITFAVLLYCVISHYAVILKGIGWVLSLFSPFILGLCIAFVLNTVLSPLEALWTKLFSRGKGKLSRRLKRPVCLILSTLIVVGVVFAILFMIVPQIKETLEQFANSIPQHMGTLNGWWNNLRAFAENFNLSIPELPAIDWISAGKKLLAFLTENYSLFIDSTVNLTATVFSTVFNLVLAVAFSIYILAQKETLGRQAKRVLYATVSEKTANRILSVCDLTAQSFSRFIGGQLTEAVIIGVLCFIGMLIFRFPYAGIISVLVGFTALIPVFGAFFGTAVGAFLILLTDPMKALWFVIFIIVLQQLEGNLIYPKVVGKSIGLPGIWVLLAVTVGGNAWGVGGMLIAVPLSSVLYTLFKRFLNERLKKKKIKSE